MMLREYRTIADRRELGQAIISGLKMKNFMPLHIGQWWGLENIGIRMSRNGLSIQLQYPANSSSPRSSRNHGTPIGGGQFLVGLDNGVDSMHLEYEVRFPTNFDWVKGGKLPGLFGGCIMSGGKAPNGSDGFSTRFMWREEGVGELYCYLPGTDMNGCSLGRGDWRFVSGRWHRIGQEIVLNTPNQYDGSITVSLDGEIVSRHMNISFRNTYALRAQGVFFSSFFGGSDESWRTMRATYIDYRAFSVQFPESAEKL